jgi:hypothetical protein
MRADVSLVVAVSLGILSLLLSFFQLFKEEIFRKAHGQYLKLEHHEDSIHRQPTMHHWNGSDSLDVIVLRLEVENTGRLPVRGVRAWLTAQENLIAGRWVPDPRFCPIHLTWLHMGDGFELPLLPSRSSYLLDLGILYPPGVIPPRVNTAWEPDRFPLTVPTLQLYTQVQPSNNSTLLGPGEYRFSYQLLTESGLRGAGTISVLVRPQQGLRGVTTDDVVVRIKRDHQVPGRRILQRNL